MKAASDLIWKGKPLPDLTREELVEALLWALDCATRGVKPFPYAVPCPDCKGTGERLWYQGHDRIVHWLESEESQKRCQTCDGTGRAKP